MQLIIRDLIYRSPLNAIIYKGGSLINKGTLSHKATNVYSEDDTEYAELSKFINDNFTWKDNKWQGTENKIRINFFAGKNLSNVTSETWQSASVAVSPELFAKLISSNSIKSISGWAAYCIAQDGGVYALYFGNEQNVSTDKYSTSRKYKVGSTSLAEVLAKAKKMPTDAETWFYVQENYGSINLTEGQAWGEIAEGKNFGAKYGDFENDK